MNFGGFYSFSPAPARKNPLSSQLPSSLFNLSLYIPTRLLDNGAKLSILNTLMYKIIDKIPNRQHSNIDLTFLFNQAPWALSKRIIMQVDDFQG